VRLPLSIVMAVLSLIDDALDAAVAGSGLAEDQVKYIFCLLFAVPFGWMFRVLPNIPTLKHLISIVISLILCSWTLGEFSWVHAVVSSLVTWLLVLVLPARHAPTVVMIWAMGYMSARYSSLSLQVVLIRGDADGCCWWWLLLLHDAVTSIVCTWITWAGIWTLQRLKWC
jgi:hypothetical protein